MTQRIGGLGFLLVWYMGLGAPQAEGGAPTAKPARAECVGPAVGFVEDRTRAWMRPACDQPLPEGKVTAQSYFDYVNSDAFTKRGRRRFTDPEFLKSATQGKPEAAPSYAVPALVMFERTRKPLYAKIVKDAIRAYRDWAKDAFAKGLHCVGHLLHEPTIAALEVKRLRQAKAMTPEDEAVARDLFLLLAEKIFTYDAKVYYCRGAHHRPMNEGAVRRIAAAWYPDAPQAARWKAYADVQWQDWWQYRDLPINDCCYFWSSLTEALISSEVLDMTETFTDPKVQPLWERMQYEVAPDGSAPPYGVRGSAAYNPAAPARIMVLELVARHTRDGRARWTAHRAFNYFKATGGMEDLEYRHARCWDMAYIGLACLFADDRVKPVAPEPASRVLSRKEVRQLPLAEVKRRYPTGLDCAMEMTSRVLPSKLTFRSGSAPGDLFMMIEAFTRHGPLCPTAIVGLTQHGSAMAIMVTESTDHGGRYNAVYIEDPSGKATFCGLKGQAPLDYWSGKPMTGPRRLPVAYEGMEAKVDTFADSPLATHAVLTVDRYQGYEVKQAREVLFVKNRFVLVRDVTTFKEGFGARVGPVWTTQNVFPEAGGHWLNCYFHFINLFEEPWRSPWRNRPWDLLVFHSPKPDRRLVIINRVATPECMHVPYAAQYVWEGDVRPGQAIQFSHLLVPHRHTGDKYLAIRSGRDPDPVHTLVAGIRFVSDTPELVAATVSADKGREEWVVLNTRGTAVNLTGKGAVRKLATDARRLYLDTAKGKRTRAWAQDATFLAVDGQDVFRRTRRADTTLGAAGQ